MSLQEVPRPRQLPGEPIRRWFSSAELDLVVWHDAGGVVVGFQLCYDKGRAEHALTWTPGEGFVHTAVDDGELDVGLRYKATPVLGPDGGLDVPRLADTFAAASAAVPGEIALFVTARLREYGGDGQG